MLRCSEKAYAQCPDRYLCGPIEDATFTEDSECDAFNRAVEGKTMTYADRIRAMNDEEMAKFLCDFRSDNYDEHPCNGCVATTYCHTGYNGMIDWLQQPVEEE